MRHLTAWAVLLSLNIAAALPADEPGPKASDRGVSEKAAPVMGELTGALRVQEPVPLDGPFPAVLLTAQVGDKLLLQVACAPEGSVVPKKVTAKVENPSLTVMDVINSGQRLFLPKAGEKVEGKGGPCFAVLLRANAAGSCEVILSCEMSDGSQKKVPFAIKVSK